ncbi:GtrA family protein [Arthrobacter sp. JSM 101049]|uniref:GtrA family protein n=1 Tax=Arthrobacter sp. JSM 101049 TaxID=929097 RepID=UPI003569F197
MLKELAHKCRGLFTMLWREVMKFGVVGGVAFVIDTTIFVWMMNGPMHGSEVKAKIVAGMVATMFSWVANRYWTFRHRRRASVVRELVLFIIMNGIGLFIAAACVWVTKYWIGLTDPTSLFIAGSVVGLVLGTIFRFFAYRFWVFTEELDAEPGFDHDHELIGHPETAAVPAVAGEATAGEAEGVPDGPRHQSPEPGDDADPGTGRRP